MQGDVIGPVAFDFVLRIVCARVMGVALIGQIPGVHLDDGAAHVSRLGVPGHVISSLESFGHELGRHLARYMAYALEPRTLHT